MSRSSCLSGAVILAATLAAARTLGAQAPAWCTTDALKGHLFQGCGIGTTRDESVRQAYGEVARLLESRVQVTGRTAQGANVAGATTQLGGAERGRAARSVSYDSAAYEVRLESDVALRGLKQRQASSHGRFYTLVTYDAAPELDKIDAALLQANAALMEGELGAALVTCRRVTALADSMPWLAGLAVSEPDCINIHDVLDARVHVALLDRGTARITFDETPVGGAFLVAARGANGVVQRGIGPSTSGGLVELPPAETFAASGGPAPRELLDVDWARLGISMIPFRARASRALGTTSVALAASVDAEDDPFLRRVAAIELQSQLRVAVGIESAVVPPADGGESWRLVVGGSLRDVAPAFGGESVASASLRWTIVDARSGRQIGAGAVVDQRATAVDEIAARETAVRLAVRRVVSEVERLAAKE